MRHRRARALLVVLTALLLVVPTAAQGHDRDRSVRDRDRHLPTTYLLDPSGQADPRIFPEGVAVRGRTFYVSSTTDGTVYRGEVDEPVARPFLLPDNPEGRTSAVGMKIDGRTLYVAGGPTGRVFAYDLRTGELVGQWQVADPTGSPTFLNDIGITRRGDVYVTDSQRPVLYRIDKHDRRTDGLEPLPVFLEYAGTPIQYGPGFNIGGIVPSRDSRYLVLAQSNARRLFRVSLDDRSVTAIDLGGEPVGADGLVLDGRTLYAIERQGDVGYVVEIRMEHRLAAGTLVGRTTSPTFDDPTTAAQVSRSLLVVNSQFGARNTGAEPGPFTVSRVPMP